MYHTQLANMIFDEVLDLTAVCVLFYNNENGGCYARFIYS